MGIFQQVPARRPGIADGAGRPARRDVELGLHGLGALVLPFEPRRDQHAEAHGSAEQKRLYLEKLCFGDGRH